MILIALSTFTFAQPANDLIQNAIDIGNGPLPFQDVDVDFGNATNTGDGGQASCDTGNAIGVWYKFMATKSGTIAATLTFSINSAIVFYSAPDIFQQNTSNLEHVDQATNPCAPNGFAEIEATANTAYYIFVSNQVNSTFSLNEQDVFEAPANDFIENAISLNNQAMPFIDQDIHFLMATDTNDDGQSGGCESGTEKVIWYKFTADVNGYVNAFFEHNVDFNAIIFYSAENENATSGADLTYVEHVDNPCNYFSEAAIDAVAGTTYYIATMCNLRGYNSLTIDASLALSVNDNKIEGFSFYPNPVQDELHLKATNALETITIYNLTGQVIYQEKGTLTNPTINMAVLSKGLYMMEVSSQGKKATYKVIKK